MITGFHGLHVPGGVIYLTVVALRVLNGFYDRKGTYETVEVAGLYMPRFSSWQARQWLDEQGYPQAPLQSLGFSVEVELGEEAPASTKELEALWTDRSLPAHLVTGDRSLAEAAAGKGFLVYLIVEPVEGNPSSGQSAGEQAPAGLRILESWREFKPNRSEPKRIGQTLTGKLDPNSPKKGRERAHEKPQGNPAES